MDTLLRTVSTAESLIVEENEFDKENLENASGIDLDDMKRQIAYCTNQNRWINCAHKVFFSCPLKLRYPYEMHLIDPPKGIASKKIETLNNLVPLLTQQMDDDWLLMLFKNLDLYIKRSVNTIKYNSQRVYRWGRTLVLIHYLPCAFLGDILDHDDMYRHFKHLISDLCYYLFYSLEREKWSNKKGQLVRRVGTEESGSRMIDVDIQMLYLDEFCIIVEITHYGLVEYLDREGKPKTNSSFNTILKQVMHRLIKCQLDYCLINYYSSRIRLSQSKVVRGT